MLTAAKRSAQTLLIAAEISPANEIARYLVFGWVFARTHNPIVSGAAFGLATFLIEGVAVLAAVDVLEGPGSQAFIHRVNQKLQSSLFGNQERSGLSIPVQIAVAMLVGCAVLVAAGQARNPTRTRHQNRRYGIRAALLMSLYFGLEGSLMGGVVSVFGWLPMIAGAVLLAALLRSLFVRIVRKRGSVSPDVVPVIYVEYRDETNEALGIGLFGDDLVRAHADPDTVRVLAGDDTGAPALPALARLELLQWFNTDLLRRTFGAGRPIYCYLHPPVSSAVVRAQLGGTMRALLDEGAVIMTERYRTDSSSPIATLVEEAERSSTFAVERFGQDEPSRVDFFIGHVKTTSGIVQKAPSFYEVYLSAIAGGLKTDPLNGAAMVDKFSDRDAEEVWKIYQRPFEELGRTDPTLAGFTFEDLKAILSDPAAAKFVYRLDGQIVTLMLFLQDLSQAPWFSQHYFETNYNDFVATKNVLVFTGIVSDESRRGQSYSLDVIDLVARLVGLRGSDLLIAFECTQVSAKYIPLIVEAAVGRSGVVTVEGLKEPAGVIDYYAIYKPATPAAES